MNQKRRVGLILQSNGTKDEKGTDGQYHLKGFSQKDLLCDEVMKRSSMEISGESWKKVAVKKHKKVMYD